MKIFYAAVMAGLFLASCAPSTPQARIAANPAQFASLGARDKALVERGEIARGMPPAAVELSWGKPSGRFEGSRDGRSVERWDYAGSRPVYSSGFYGGYGYGYGRYGYGYPYSVYGYGPEVTYVPYHLASVWFVRGRVDSWEKVR